MRRKRGIIVSMKKRSKFTPGDFKVRVGRSRTGKGLFAVDMIPKGACVIEYTGRPVSEKEQYTDRGKYLFWSGKNTMINGNIPTNTARYINHSCAPNCESDGPEGKVFIMALRTIMPGEELTYDYGEEYFDKHIKPYGCKCASCLAQKEK